MKIFNYCRLFMLLIPLNLIAQTIPHFKFGENTSIAVKGGQNIKKTWVFILAGQSNMAGRAKVEAIDTMTDPRILSINEKGEIIEAKEPLHFYEPKMKGTGCGLAFGKELLKHVPKDVSILLIPTAVGGSLIKQWINDSPFRGVQLLTNFRDKVELGKQYGEVKAILWHQGESDSNPEGVKTRKEKLRELFTKFREAVGNPSLPILMGELGSYSKDKDLWNQMNEQTRLYSVSDQFTSVISTSDFEHKGDFLHFNSAGQREMGKRFAREYLRKFGTGLKAAQNKSVSQPTVVLTFDDAIRSHFTVVAPLLKKYGFGATFFVCEKVLKSPGDSIYRLLWPQISELNKMGFEIGNHTGHHKGVGKLNHAQLTDEIRYIEDKCSAYGIPRPTSFAYPGNRSDSASQVVLAEMGYRFARAGGTKLYNPDTDNPLELPSYTMCTDDPIRIIMTRKLLENLLPGQILIFTIHGVPDTANLPYSTTPEVFTEYLEYMKEHNFNVIALRDLNKL